MRMKRRIFLMKSTQMGEGSGSLIPCVAQILMPSAGISVSGMVE